VTHLALVQAVHDSVNALHVAGYTAPQHVTRWGVRIALTGLTLFIIVLALLGMRRGWKNKAKRQAAIPAPAPIPASDAVALVDSVEGSYLASTSADQWLDRIVVHSLGVPSKALVTVRSDGIACEREGEPDFFIATSDIAAIRLDRGIAGEVYEAGSVLIVTWQLGDVLLDSGFRAQQTDSQIALATAIRTLLEQAPEVAPAATPATPPEVAPEDAPEDDLAAAPIVPNEGAS
jgi:hypothetical protein